MRDTGSEPINGVAEMKRACKRLLTRLHAEYEFWQSIRGLYWLITMRFVFKLAVHRK